VRWFHQDQPPYPAAAMTTSATSAIQRPKPRRADWRWLMRRGVLRIIIAVRPVRLWQAGKVGDEPERKANRRLQVGDRSLPAVYRGCCILSGLPSCVTKILTGYWHAVPSILVRGSLFNSDRMSDVCGSNWRFGYSLIAGFVVGVSCQGAR
jgi:hypothetical protein